MAALSISDAAKAIGHSSRSQLYRLMKDGRLDDFVCWRGGKRLIEVNGLAAAVKELTQQRSNSATLVEAEGAVDWEQIATTCNGWLAGDGWSQRPWSPTMWATLYFCLADAIAESQSDS
jgi:hypothetical protein